MDLALFSLVKQAEIRAAVAAPKPPSKWLDFGDAGARKPFAAIRSRAWAEWYRQRGRNPDAVREPLPPAMRRLVIRRDGLVCHLCGGAVERCDVHIDHVIPWSLGGETVAANLKVSHSVCNIRKGNRT
jgi:hypothetical protein